MKTLKGTAWSKGIISASNNLLNNKNKIDALNVFPVPDGDTGTNMSATISASKSEILKNNNDDLSLVSKQVARAMLLGARGNSGVILSQIFKGFANGFAKKKTANINEIVNAFKLAKEKAYASVLTPVEGTILTVIKDISNKLIKEKNNIKDIDTLFEIACKEGRKSCNSTPDFLQILKEVGVTDSGGEGLLLILEGIRDSLLGKEIAISQEKEKMDNFVSNTEVYDGEFGYCTEFIIKLKNSKRWKKDNFIEQIEKLGSSIVVVQDEKIVKVHIHTEKPGKVLNYSQRSGKFLKIKCDNMSEQASSQKSDVDKTKKLKTGIISCNTGPGIISLMKEHGTDYIIEGGQTNNPSAADIITAIKAVNSDTILILPNNSNIILAAKQAAKVVKDKKVVVIPTKTQEEGITAILHFSQELDFEDNIELIEEGLDGVQTGQITIANRDTTIEKVKIKNGEFLALTNRKVIASCRRLYDAWKAIVKEIINEDTEVVTIYYGEDSNETDAQEVKNHIESNYDVEVTVKYGGQPVYYFLISAEE